MRLIVDWDDDNEGYTSINQSPSHCRKMQMKMDRFPGTKYKTGNNKKGIYYSYE